MYIDYRYNYVYLCTYMHVYICTYLCLYVFGDHDPERGKNPHTSAEDETLC